MLSDKEFKELLSHLKETSLLGMIDHKPTLAKTEREIRDRARDFFQETDRLSPGDQRSLAEAQTRLHTDIDKIATKGYDSQPRIQRGGPEEMMKDYFKLSDPQKPSAKDIAAAYKASGPAPSKDRDDDRER